MKISVLWLVAIGTFMAYLVLMLFEPGVIGQIITGEVGGMKIGQEVLLLFAIIALAPLTMAFLTLILKDSINRWANIVVAAVLVVFELTVLAEDLAKPYAYAILIGLAKPVVLTLIIWYAWKSKPKT